MLESLFDSPKHFYTFYYDESNNARKLLINRQSDSYNIDNDEVQAAASNFMLAGVAHKGPCSTAKVGALFANLRRQPSAEELKFNQVASGKFDMVLNSQQIRQILQWVLESDLYLHYFNLNIEYWSFIDIIDDCALYCLQLRKLEFRDEGHYRYVTVQPERRLQ